jgi:arylsulfatase
MFGNRGIYHQGWTAVTRHRTPWEPKPLHTLEDDVWELYETTKDWTQARDVAAEQPERLRDLKQLFLIEAAKYYVLPLDDRSMERFNSEIAGRPELIHGDTQLLSGSMRRLSENSMLNLKNKSHSVTAEVEVPEGGANGVIVTQGGAFGGWCLYARGGRLHYCYNYVGLQRYYVESDRALPKGTHQVRMEFKYDGGGVGKGGDVTLYVDGKKVGRGRVEKTMAYVYSEESADVGMELGSSVAEGFHDGDSKFTGRVKWVQLDKGKEDFDHYLSLEERFRGAMARQ